ncbi:MAG: DUF4215 domain-containing protein [Deltaproteobacteria bacterium]|nr:DUF4215 domain-containing protein [Deltaproteobacteria bacterium]
MRSAFYRHGLRLLLSSVLLVMAACAPQRPPLPLAVPDRRVPPQPSLPVSAPSVVSTARISADEAVVRALNTLRPTPEGYRLRHPRYTVDFTGEGVAFQPRGAELPWRWQFIAVEGATGTLPGVQDRGVKPTQHDASTIVYRRGPLEEQYIAHRGSVEQQFVIPQPLPLAGGDLTIRGRVQSVGVLETQEKEWLWREGEHRVRLGKVRVYDAHGAELVARMTVNADTTTIVVEGAMLATAAYPIVIDPEIGVNDFAMSDMGSGSSGYLYDALDPAVAYNSANNEYLVVWEGDDNTAPLVNNEFEIFGQRINAATGEAVGTNDFRISDMGPNGNTNYRANDPKVAYNSTDNEYLVVWWGDDNTTFGTVPLADNENEIFGQRLNAATGAEIGTNDFRISTLGPDGNANYDAGPVDVVYDSLANRYLVVWAGVRPESFPPSSFSVEVYGQLLTASGEEIESSLTGQSISFTAFGSGGYGPLYVAAACNPEPSEFRHRYLVVWNGDDQWAPTADNEFEVYGNLLDSTGSTSSGDFRISDMGPDGNPNYGVSLAPIAVTYNPARHEYLVVWSGDDNTPPLVDGEFEIFGQRLTAAGAQIGTNDFRISRMGPDGNPNYDANTPAVVYNKENDEYLVTWSGDDTTAPLANNEFEIFGQRLDTVGTAIGNAFRLSNMGPDGDARYIALTPALTYNSTNNEYFTVWAGDLFFQSVAQPPPNPPVLDGDFEIYGQRFTNCGDTAVDTGEQCDDGNFILGDGCRSDCTVERCGDGIKDPQEQCDDGNFILGDGCRSDCTVERCGDGIKDPQEQCDDGNPILGDGCRVDCTVELCGDGIKDPQEQCDDGNEDLGDGCRLDCTVESCGDGIKDPVEECDDGNTSNGDSCLNSCRNAVCGDGFVWGGVEQCDDHNLISGDGCDFNCTRTACGNGVVTSGEQCDDGNPDIGDGCRPNCTTEFCGDGIIDPQEQCDPVADPPGCETGSTCQPDSLTSCSCVIAPAEICNNCVDDDADNLVDLLDPDCLPFSALTIAKGTLTLRPNPNSDQISLKASLTVTAKGFNPVADGLSLSLSAWDGAIGCFPAPGGVGWVEDEPEVQWSFSTARGQAQSTTTVEEKIRIRRGRSSGQYDITIDLKGVELTDLHEGPMATGVVVGGQKWRREQEWMAKAGGKKLQTPR